MSGLDTFIPAPNDPADLPAALRKFAEWVEQQKTAMEATVRAEVAKVDQATIAANVLAQVPATIAPFEIDISKDLDGFYPGSQRQSNGPVPAGARAVKISARGGPCLVDGSPQNGQYLPAPWQHLWVDLGQVKNLRMGTVLGSSIEDPYTHLGATKVVIYVDGQGDSKYFNAVVAPGASLDQGNVAANQGNSVQVRGDDTLGAVCSMTIFEYYRSVPYGAVTLPFT